MAPPLVSRARASVTRWSALEPFISPSPRAIRGASDAPRRATWARAAGLARCLQRTEVFTMIIWTAIVALGVILAVAGPHLSLAQDEIKLGAFMPISGISADVGAQIKAGIEVAVERVGTVPVGGKP